MRRILENLLICWSLIVSGVTQTAPVQPSQAARASAPKRVLAKICVRCVRSHMDFLASDAMNGRGSATHDELVAATYVASQLHAYGAEPAGDNGGYLQRATVLRQQLAGPPKLVASRSGEQPLDLAYGRDFLSVYLSQTHFEGELQKLDAENAAKQTRRGAVVLIEGDDSAAQNAAFAAVTAGAAGALMQAPASRAKHFSETGAKPPKMPVRLESSADTPTYNVVQLSKDAFTQFVALADGTPVKFDIPSKDEKAYTWNAVGILRGWDPALKHSAILLSAHLDHLGIGDPVNGDDIYNGADDDASGTTAVLELARTLGSRRPRRTVIFALFGSEEFGGLGSTYFREHPPVPLTDLAANLEFEMLGRPDPKLSADTLYLTGWERSNLGPVLAAHGARLVGDPHPEQNFFARSDNYVLAQKGVVAQTVSSYGLHNDYHRPSDDLAHIDFTHMDAAIGSLLGPVEWLVNSGFRPKWNEGGKP